MQTIATIDTHTLELVKIIVSIFTPVVLLFLGLVINRTIERNRNILLKEKDWESVWANKFLICAHEYSKTLSICVSNIFLYMEDKKNNKAESELEEIKKEIENGLKKMIFWDWEIQNYIQFSNKYEKKITETQRMVYKLVKKMYDDEIGNFKEIRKLQFKFNSLVRNAHAEILKIKSEL